MHRGIRAWWLIGVFWAAASGARGPQAEACPIPIQRPLAANMWHTVPWGEVVFRQIREAVQFDSVVRPSFDGFRCEQIVGNFSLWLNPEHGQILLVDLAKPTAERISGFPQQFGPIVAIGRDNDHHLVVRLKLNQHAMMVIIDPVAKSVKHVAYLPAELFAAESQ